MTNEEETYERFHRPGLDGIRTNEGSKGHGVTRNRNELQNGESNHGEKSENTGTSFQGIRETAERVIRDGREGLDSVANETTNSDRSRQTMDTIPGGFKPIQDAIKPADDGSGTTQELQAQPKPQKRFDTWTKDELVTEVTKLRAEREEVTEYSEEREHKFLIELAKVQSSYKHKVKHAKFHYIEHPETHMMGFGELTGKAKPFMVEIEMRYPNTGKFWVPVKEIQPPDGICRLVESLVNQKNALLMELSMVKEQMNLLFIERNELQEKLALPSDLKEDE